jgi:predicted DNA-binding ribbon-helix-helix protein
MKKRSVSIRGHRTSLSLEDGFWDEVAAIARSRGISVAALITEIDRTRMAGLSSAVRLFVLEDLKQKAAACRTETATLD